MSVRYRNSATPSSSSQETEVDLSHGLPVNVVSGSGSVYATRTDDASSTITYVGKAAVGSLTASAVWLIFRMDTGTTNQLIITYADGDSSFDNIWDNRASLSYS